VDYSIKVRVTFDYLSSSNTNQELFTVINSTNSHGQATFNLYGIDPRITYENVLDHQFVFIVGTYNLLGIGGNRSTD
jgi:predicted metallopeptidase